MHGKNVVTKPIKFDGKLRVVEFFYTVQGEGPWAGYPAIFVRMQYCNLQCAFCDTAFDQGKEWTVEALAHQVEALSQFSGCERIVITGGEPLLQEIGHFMTHPFMARMKYQIETAGTVFNDNFRHAMDTVDTTIVCSPKTPRVHPDIVLNANAWKYIIREGEVSEVDGLPLMPGYSHKASCGRAVVYRGNKRLTYVQPCDEGEDKEKSQRNMQLATKIAMEYGYRLSLQLHKIIGVE